MVLEGREILPGQTGHEAGRALLAQMYQTHTGLPVPPIATAPGGKPYFENSSLHFSVTHTKHHLFVALSERIIGIDAEEKNRPIDLRLAKRYLSPAEFSRWEEQEDREDALLRLWVLKESYAKLTGRGWGDYLKETDFYPDDSRIQVVDGCYLAILEE